MDKLDTVECMTDRYFERGGRTLIGIYYLPQTAQNDTGNYWAQSTVRLIGERRNALGDNPYFCLNTRQK